MAQQALGPGTAVPRRRALFGLLDADGWGWASVKAFVWLIFDSCHSGTITRGAPEDDGLVMRDIKPGSPVTYSEFARLAGRPAAIRAAAAACARNPVALFTPCHRVLRLDGSLGGYRWGLDVKRWLLNFEADRN